MKWLRELITECVRLEIQKQESELRELVHKIASIDGELINYRSVILDLQKSQKISPLSDTDLRLDVQKIKDAIFEKSKITGKEKLSSFARAVRARQQSRI